MDNPLFWSKPSVGKHFQVDTGGTLTTGLVAYYKMEDSTDYWSTYSGTPTNVTFSAGKINNAGNFYGNSKIVSTINSGLSGSFSVAFWVYFSDNSNRGVLESYVSSYNNYWFNISRYNQKISIAMYDGTNNPNAASTQSLSSGTWYHLIFVRNTVSDNISLYINNSLDGQATDTTTSTPSYQYFNIGLWQNPSLYHTGQIDEIGIWSKVLSSQERTDLYNSGNGQTMIS